MRKREKTRRAEADLDVGRDTRAQLERAHSVLISVIQTIFFLLTTESKA